MNYFYRAKRQSSLLPMSQRLAWVEARDLEGRSEWVSKFRESSKALSCTCHGVTRQRRAAFLQQCPPSQMVLGKPVNGKKTAKVMKDGTRLRTTFQQGQCRNPKGSCPQGHHKCGVVVRGDRARGMPGHGVLQCRAKVSP